MALSLQSGNVVSLLKTQETAPVNLAQMSLKQCNKSKAFCDILNSVNRLRIPLLNNYASTTIRNSFGKSGNEFI